jgi:hypothetical protein
MDDDAERRSSRAEQALEGSQTTSDGLTSIRRDPRFSLEVTSSKNKYILCVITTHMQVLRLIIEARETSQLH